MKLKKLFSFALAAAITVSSMQISAAAGTVSKTSDVKTTVTESVSREYLAGGDKLSRDGLLFTELENGTYEVGYNYNAAKPVGTVVIPESVNGRLVTRIADAGFAYCDDLVNVVVPNSVISVGANAFYGTKFLNNQTGPIKYAGKVAVYCDPDATSVVIAEGTLGLADKLFYHSPELVSATLPAGLLNLGSMTFNDCQKLTTVNIPDGIKTIGSGVFADCRSLSYITIPNGVTGIGAYAFYNTALSSITIPESVIKIGKSAFEGSSLSTNGVTIGSGYIDIGGRVFASTPFYESQGNMRYAGNVFLGCGDGVTEATLKDGTTAIADMALSGHKNIASVTIPSSVKTIGEDAFFNCRKLTAITIPEGVVGIGEDAFRLCEGLASVSLPMSLETIDQGAFYGCSNLGTVSYPGSAVDWATNIDIGSENDPLLNVQPTLGKFPKTPDPVTGATVTDTGSDSVSLSWNASSIADNYRVDALINGNWITLGGTSTTSLTVSGLAAYTEYQFRIYALARNILSTPVEISAKTRVAAVSNVRASSTQNSVTLSWAAVPDVDYYAVDILKDGQWQPAGRTSSNTETSVTVGGLNEKTVYQFKIWTFKGNEYSPSVAYNAVTAAIIYPDTVTGLRASGATASSITLSWNPTSTADSYEIDMYKNGRWIYVDKITGSSYTVGGLSANTSYDFKVFSFRGENYSSSARLTAKTAAPAAPETVTGLRASGVTASSITLSWNPTSTADSYEIDMYKNGKWIYVDKITGSSYTVGGLSANTSYDFKVFSFKGENYSSSARLTAKTAAPAAPETVTGLRASGATASSITLSWNPTSTADSYEIDMYKNGRWVYLDKITGSSYTVGGLSANTSYDFKVFSFKGSKYSSSARLTARTAAASSNPETVTGLRASGVTASSITLSWNPTSTADSYEIDMYKNGRWIYVDKISGSSYTVGGLSANTSYDFKVFSFKGSKYSSSARLTARTAAASSNPETVTGLRASGATASSITLSWDPTSTADSYEIDMYKNGRWIYVDKITGSSYTVSGLSANTSYDFKVFSFKGSKYSSSARLTARTAAASSNPETVTGLRASGATTSSLTLSWNPTSTADSYEIDMYKNGKWIYVDKITGSSYTVGGLSANTSYDFKVFSFKGSKYSSSARLTAKTASLYSSSTPATVTGLRASGATASSLTLSWNLTPTADSYEIDMYKDGRWIYVAKITGNSYTVGGLSANTSYDFKVFSFNGSKYSSSARITAGTRGAVLAPPTYNTIAPKNVLPAELSNTQVMMRGIDVSGWQGEIDFKAVKSSGIDFVIIKTGEGPVVVDTWEKNYKNAKDAGLLVGAYWFCTSTTIDDAIQEANRFIGALNGKQLDFPVYLDMETMGQFNNGKAFCTQLVETFCSELENAGYYAGVYCSKYWYTNYVDDNVRMKRPNWIAQYDDKCYYNGGFGIWQFDADTVPGVEFDCDRNWGYYDYSGYIKDHKLNGY